MARNALSEDEIRSTYEHLKANLPRIPDALLREISSNDSFDAIQDVDVNDVILTLSAPGPLVVLSSEIGSQFTPESVMFDLTAKITASGTELSAASGVFLIVKSCQWRMADFGEFRILLENKIHPRANFVSTWYHDRRVVGSEGIKLILAGVSTLKKFEPVDPKEDRRWHFERTHEMPVPMDIPAFLRKPVNERTPQEKLPSSSVRWLNLWMAFWLYLVRKLRK